MFDFEEELKKLPTKPGVYIMHDEADTIIYVGKAISLRNRVRQYFRKAGDGRPKIEKMMPHVKRFEYIVTDSELEALVLENNLIKEHSPKYNTMLKDGKTYPYIKVTYGEAYPRLLFSRQMKKDKSKYFGPYTSAGAVKDMIDLLNKTYQLRNCTRNLPADIGKQRPCLNYQIKQCAGPCQNYISREEYGRNVARAVDFLNGNYKPLIQMIEDKMYKASEEMAFEDAAGYRELLRSAQAIAQKQKITNSDCEDKDIVAFCQDGKEAVAQVFFVRDGRLIGRDHFFLNVAGEDTPGEIMGSFLTQFYGGTPYIPKELLLQEAPDDLEEISKWLADKAGCKITITIPQKGSKEKLVELAKENARMILFRDRERIRREEARTKGAMQEIANLLGIPEIIRVEAFDISNISGFASVGSMVVFEEGKPKKSDYRKFRLRTVMGPDDYASMYEVLSRRFTHGMEEQKELKEKNIEEGFGRFSKFPDLIMMDGGKGQVNVAQKVLDELHLSIKVCGMVKDDNHRTRGLYYQNQELPMDLSGEGFKLITRIQDEAHRFAIEYHRSLRSKGQVHSVLDDIEGVGPARRKALMRHYQSLDQIRQASEEELAKIDSMNQQSARQVYHFFHVEDGK